MEITLADEKYQLSTMPSSALCVKPKQSIGSSDLSGKGSDLIILQFYVVS